MSTHDLTLTALQRAVLHRLVHGMTRAEIADEKGTDPIQITGHLRRMRHRNGIATVDQLVARFVRAYPDCLDTPPPPFPRVGKHRIVPAIGFPRALYLVRERYNLSGYQLAERAALDASLISRLEAGKRTPTHATVSAISTGLNLRGIERDRFYLAAGLVTPQMAKHLERTYFTEDQEAVA